MNRLRAFILVLLFLGCPAPSLCLEPCRDIFSDYFACYHATVDALLAPPKTGSPVPFVRMVVLPSFSPEWAISLYPEGGSARVDLRVASKPLWDEYSDCPALIERPRNVTVQPHSARLSKKVADGIVTVWREALLHLEPFAGAWSHGSDGVSYHASAWLSGYGLTCGVTWSPGSGRDQLLVRLAEGLRAYAEQPSAETSAQLRSLMERVGKAEGSRQ